MLTLLRCNHTAEYDPTPELGDEVYCRKCGDYSIVKLNTAEWRWRCFACATSRRFGADETEVYRAARRHQRKYHHVVLVMRGYEVKGTVGPEGQGELSVGEDRIQWVRQHQGALRAVVERVIVQRGQSNVDS